MTDNDSLVIYLHHCSHHLQCRFIFLITVSLIWISHFDSNVDVTMLYSCPHICLPPPPTQADAEAVRESISWAFARGTIPRAASAGLLSHCLIARACSIGQRMQHCSIARALPAHAHAAWPTHGSCARIAAYIIERRIKVVMVATPAGIVEWHWLDEKGIVHSGLAVNLFQTVCSTQIVIPRSWRGKCPA